MVQDWKNIDVRIGGQKIENITSINYTTSEHEILLSHTENAVKMKKIPTMEFYLKRKNKYYFKNSFGAKFFIESDEILPFKKGDKFNINIE